MHHRSRFTRWAVAAALIVVVLVVVYAKRQAIMTRYDDMTQPTPPASVPAYTEPQKPEVKKPEPQTPPATDMLPDSFNLDVPFVLQAPLANWDAVHEETCEEAAVLSVSLFYKKQTMTLQQVEAKLQEIVAGEKKLLGFFEDTNLKETALFAKELLGLTQSRVIENPTIPEIKRELYARRPVLAPSNGKLLNNPNFKNGGPIYHMLVVRGWNSKGFFVDDPGTRKGENYFYTYATFQNALHDWDGNHDGTMGPKRVLILTP